MRGVGRELLYYGTAAVIILGLMEYVTTKHDGASSVPYYLIILVIASLFIALAGLKREAKLASWLIFAGIAVVCLSFSAHGFVQAAHANRLATERAHQRGLNSQLELGSSAVFSDLLVPSLGNYGRLLMKVTAIDYSAHAVPTNLRGGGRARIFDVKHRVWTDPESGGDKLLTASFTVENRSRKTITLPLQSAELLAPVEDSGEEGFSAKWYRPAGTATARRAGGVELRPGTGGSYVLYFYVPEDTPKYLDGFRIHASSGSGGQYGASLAQWAWFQRRLGWQFVGTFRGESGPFTRTSGSFYDATPSGRYWSRSRSFTLGGGMVKIAFRISRPKWSPPDGPYIEMNFDNLTTGELGTQETLLPDPDLQTDYYHFDRMQLEEKTPGKYRLVVLSCNCRWSFDVYEQVWE